MSAKKEQKSHAAGWVVSILLVPVFYLLSYGPARYLAMKLPPSAAGDALMEAFAAPYNWLVANTEFEELLEEYVIWWQELALMP